MTTRQVLGIGGSLVLVVGVFAPIVSVPIVGDLNSFQNGRGDGTIVLVLALISLLLVMRGLYRGLWVTGILSAATLTILFLNVLDGIGDVRAHLERELAGNPFRGLADVAMQSVQIQWGWALLVVGTLGLLAAAGTRDGDSIGDLEQLDVLTCLSVVARGQQLARAASEFAPDSSDGGAADSRSHAQ
jgi:amino acid transporter